MRIATLLTLAGLVLGGPAFAADAKDLDGKWVIVSVERAGKADEAFKGAVREIKDGKYTLTPKEGKPLEGTFTVDGAKKTIDIKPTEGNYKGKTLLGIYKLEGDMLTVCFAEPDQERPTEFASKAGVVLVVHQRHK